MTEENKRKVGRPKGSVKDPSTHKTAQIRINVTPELAEEIKKRAREAGKSISAMMVLKFFDGEIPVLKKD